MNPIAAFLLVSYSLTYSYAFGVICLAVIMRLSLVPLTSGWARFVQAQKPHRRLQPNGIGVGVYLVLLLQIPLLVVLSDAVGHLSAANPVNVLHLSHDALWFLPSLSAGLPALIPMEPVVMGLFDLNQPDRLLIIPALTVVTTYISLSRRQLSSRTPWTNQVVHTVLAAGFGVLVLSAPAALGVFVITFNLVSLAQRDIVKQGHEME